MKHCFLPAPARLGCQLKHRTVLVVVTADKGRSAVEVAGGIDDQAAVGLEPILAQAEVMQHLLPPTTARFGYQLERCAPAVSTFGDRRAIKIASCIEDHTGEGLVPVLAVEAVQELLLPAPTRFGDHFKHRTVVVSAAILRRAIEIASCVKNQTGV